MNSEMIRKKLARAERGSKIEAAIIFVVAYFDGMFRIGKQCPAVIHSLRVGSQLERYGADTATILAGFLHDVVEDTRCTEQIIFGLFGEQVGMLVRACSDDMSLDAGQRRDDLFRRVELQGAEAIAIKVVDVTDNLHTIGDVKPEWQTELIYCGRRWLQLGEKYLGVDAPHCMELRKLLKEAEDEVR